MAATEKTAHFSEHRAAQVGNTETRPPDVADTPCTPFLCLSFPSAKHQQSAVTHWTFSHSHTKSRLFVGSHQRASRYTFQIRFASSSVFAFSKNHWAGMTLQRSPNPPHALRMIVHSAALVYHPSSQCTLQAELTQILTNLGSFARTPPIFSNLRNAQFTPFRFANCFS